MSEYKVYVVSTDLESAKTIEIEGKERQRTLSESDDKAIALNLEQLFSTISKDLQSVIEEQSELSIEVSASMTVKALGNVKAVFLNVGGEGSSSNTTKIVLKTTLNPNKAAPGDTNPIFTPSL